MSMPNVHQIFTNKKVIMMQRMYSNENNEKIYQI